MAGSSLLQMARPQRGRRWFRLGYRGHWEARREPTFPSAKKWAWHACV